MTSPIGQIVTITSGKGGVGKTSVTVNLGLALVQKGLRVCVVDADTNLANINIMLKQVPEYTLEHVINGDKTIREIMLQKDGLYVVPAATGVPQLVDQNKKKSRSVIEAVASLKNEFDFVLIDTSAGISDSVLGYIKGSHQSIFVITSEPTSLTDSYSLLKVMFKSKMHNKIDIVVNFSQNEKHAKNVFSRFSGAVEKYMDYRIGYLGFVYRDDYLSSSVCFQSPMLVERPNSKTSECFRNVARNLHAGLTDLRENNAPDVDFDRADKRAEFSNEEKIEKTVSLVNLENDLDKYLTSNRDSKEEIELTMKRLADKYQQVFSATPAKIQSKAIKDIKQVEAIKSLKLKSVAKVCVSEPERVDPEYSDYLGSIHFASLLGDYAESNYESMR